jgi:hypothetical protein
MLCAPPRRRCLLGGLLGRFRNPTERDLAATRGRSRTTNHRHLRTRRRLQLRAKCGGNRACLASRDSSGALETLDGATRHRRSIANRSAAGKRSDSRRPTSASLVVRLRDRRLADSADPPSAANALDWTRSHTSRNRGRGEPVAAQALARTQPEPRACQGAQEAVEYENGSAPTPESAPERRPVPRPSRPTTRTES